MRASIAVTCPNQEHHVLFPSAEAEAATKNRPVSHDHISFRYPVLLEGQVTCHGLSQSQQRSPSIENGGLRYWRTICRVGRYRLLHS